MLKKTFSIAVVASAIVASSAMPASAVPWSGSDLIVGDSVDYTYWDLNEAGSLDHSGIVHDENSDGQLANGEDLNADGILDAGEDTNSNGELDLGPDYEFDRVWCGTSGGLELDGDDLDNADLDRVVAANGDVVISGTGEFRGGDLDATVEYRVFAEGDLLRTSYVVTNNTNAAITVTPSTVDDTTDNSDSGTTSSGDSAIGNSDLWWTQYNTDFDDNDWLGYDGYTGTLYSPSVVFGRFYGSPGLIAADFSDFDPFGGESDDVTFTDVTIQPGASYQWIFFYQMLSYDQSAGANPDPEEDLSANAGVVTAAAAASDNAADEFGADLELTGRLARGLDAHIDSNWVINPELADTGVDASGIAIGGAMLAAAGIAFVATRRRKASN